MTTGVLGSFQDKADFIQDGSSMGRNIYIWFSDRQRKKNVRKKWRK